MSATATPNLNSLDDEALAKLMQAPIADIDKLREFGCPSNQDGTWKYVVVLAWVEQRIGEHYRPKK